MADRYKLAADDLASIAADVEIVVTKGGDNNDFSLSIAKVRGTHGELQTGSYRAIILVLREPKEQDANVV